MSEEFKEKLRAEALSNGFEFFGVVDAAELAKVPFPPNRCLDTPYGFYPKPKALLFWGGTSGILYLMP